jgi:hypothetical protein
MNNKSMLLCVLISYRFFWMTGVDIDLQPLELAQMLLIWRYDVALEVSTITIAFTLSGITFVLSHFLIFFTRGNSSWYCSFGYNSRICSLRELLINNFLLNNCVKSFTPSYLNKLFLQLFCIVISLTYYLRIMW